ncbi:ribosome recycling factor [Candidatus Giovannonibacteria bacterium]|nr:ribosome recycling factor [Candidatus Giovannonibacteria bacterium]
MPSYDFKKLDEKITALRERFKNETAGLRTGRANPALVEDIKVEAYGAQNPLKNLASITVENAKTLLIQPWDKSLLEALEKGISASSLGLRPSVQKDVIRVILPDLTQERRETLTKLLKEKLEEARVLLRQARDETWKDIQERERAKTISEDEKFRLKGQMEEQAKKGTEKLEEAAKKKEREILE